MESSYGGRTEPRIREHFDRLVDRISAYEIKALAAGDGFTEKRYEPASIDELLALSATFTPPPATPGACRHRGRGSQDGRLRRADSASIRRFCPTSTCSRAACTTSFRKGLTRGSKYLPMIQNVFRAEGLPLDLAYIPLIESAFKPNALSRAKAKGVWQFMRGTGIENGLRHDWYIDERSDPEKATVAAAKYLVHAVEDVRGRLASGARVVQRRPRPRSAGHEAGPAERFLEAVGESQPAAARDARVRPHDSGGRGHCPEPGAVRFRIRAASRCRRISS